MSLIRFTKKLDSPVKPENDEEERSENNKDAGLENDNFELASDGVTGTEYAVVVLLSSLFLLSSLWKHSLKRLVNIVKKSCDDEDSFRENGENHRKGETGFLFIISLIF